MIDAHFHAWSLVRGDYDWLTPALAPIYRDMQVSEWQSQSQPQGIAGGVLVQAAPTAADTDYLLTLAQENANVLGVVGWVDMLATDAVAQVERLAREPLLKGLRPMLQDLPDPDWILLPALTPVLHAMARCGLVFDALIFPVHLPRIAALIERHPDLTVVIDHGAKPSRDNVTDWMQGISALARHSDPARVVCKLSGLWTQVEAGSQVQVLAPWVSHLMDCWGPSRLLWGSDWPVLELAGTYAQWSQWSHAVLQSCTPEQKQAILGGNARRIYKL